MPPTIVSEATISNLLRQRERQRWYGIISRCTNPKDDAWPNYGGRGITVCPEWLASFDAYYAAVGDAPDGTSLDRIDNDGPYAPWNVRWATPAQQAANRRRPTHCGNGHRFDAVTTYVKPSGRRGCRPCRAENLRDWRKARRAVAS